ncbi:MAG: ABC-2 type transport system ATP-binding protein [Rickettsiales bacterium]|jgi:ABC-2 type transport system ATP-binding protein
MSNKIINIKNLSKTYAGGFEALKNVNLDINEGEIFALLGSNGAGKTTLISVICGLANMSSGEIKVGGHDILKDYRAARSLIGLVPQELTTDMFETVLDTVIYTRGLFGKKKNPALIEKTLRDLSLWEKRNSKIVTLSGGMKRRVMIAKALSHEPKILFLDEPTAGVDVKLRKDMWNLVADLRKSGVTIILTTHYIDEAEQMADRIGVIQAGKIILIEEKEVLMKKLGQKELHLELFEPIKEIPQNLASSNLKLSADGGVIIFTYDATKKNNGIANLLEEMKQNGIVYQDLKTHQSSLEDIFIQLVK